MPSSEPPVRWAPRVRQDTIRRLYQLDARGILDEELIDKVGFALYSRCRSILHVSDAMTGRVHCPRCDAIIQRRNDTADQILRCSACGWETLWSTYVNTYRHQELGAGGARDIFEEFVEHWERARTPRDKMVLIDQLIHRWHWETRHERPRFGLGRPTGVNLIEGSRKDVLHFLDTLTYGDASTSGVDTTKVAWREHWREVREGQGAERTKSAPAEQPGPHT